MKLIEPRQQFAPDVDYGDILCFSQSSFIVARVDDKPTLISLDTGAEWYSKRANHPQELKAIVEKDFKTVTHYSQAQYRMYLEAP